MQTHEARIAPQPTVRAETRTCKCDASFRSAPTIEASRLYHAGTTPVGRSTRRLGGGNPPEPSGVEVLDGLLNLQLRVHHERAVTNDGLVQRLTTEHQQRRIA